MSNPYRPNTASIPNILFDYWMERLTPAEFKVLMAIARKTYGWNKTRDRISLKQITKLTGLHRTGVIKSLDNLVEIGVILKFKNKDEFDGGDLPNEYEINTECEGGVENKEGGSLHSRPPPVDSVDYPPVDTVDPQNTLYTKHTIQKREREAAPAPARNFSSKKAKEEEKLRFGDYVLLSQNEHTKLLDKYGKEKLEWMIEHLNAKIGSKIGTKEGKKYEYSSHYAVLGPTNWVHVNYVQQAQQPQSMDNFEADKVLAQKIWDKYKGRKEIDIELGYKYIEFKAGPATKQYNFGEKNFKENCFRELKIRKLNTEGL